MVRTRVVGAWALVVTEWLDEFANPRSERIRRAPTAGPPRPEPLTAPNSVNAFSRDNLKARLAGLAARGIYIGTSSWKYPGWCGLVFDEQRYLTHHKFSEAKFNRECLSEYAETFSTVCVDAGYYTFPTEKYLSGLCSQVPEGFKFAFKVTDEITIRKFPYLPRFGARVGLPNPNFLNAEMFARLSLKPCEPFREQIGPLIFEFSTFHRADFANGREFVAALDQFLGAIPRDREYGVEIRNHKWLQPEYFAMLRSHGVAHVFNSWTRMPPIAEQIALAGSLDTADFSVSRFLLKPGRTYEEAKRTFQPYAEIKEPNADAREAGRQIVRRMLIKKGKTYLYVNNRLEGCSPVTIDGIVSAIDSQE